MNLPIPPDDIVYITLERQRIAKKKGTPYCHRNDYCIFSNHHLTLGPHRAPQQHLSIEILEQHAIRSLYRICYLYQLVLIGAWTFSISKHQVATIDPSPKSPHNSMSADIYCDKIDGMEIQ